jgi:DNA-binding CsgD family transcriptional regulator
MTDIKPPKDTAITNPVESHNVINFKGLRQSSLPYLLIWVIYYAWVILFTTWWTASPLTDHIFSSSMRSMLHSVNLISSAVFIFIIKKEWYVKTARMGAIVLIVGMITFLVSHNGHVSLIAIITIGIFVGCINISILMPFVFKLNNTEKFYAVVGSYFLIGLISLIIESGISSSISNRVNMLISFGILLVSLSAILFFKKDAVLEVTAGPQSIKMPRRVYLTLVFNCIFAFLFKGIGTGILNITAASSAFPVLLWYAVGELAGCLVYFIIYGLSKKSIHLAWNISFSCLTMGLLFNAFANQNKGLTIAFGVLLGIGNTIGMVNVYYILGVIGKKYNSMRYLQFSILFIGVCGGVAGVAMGNLVSNIHTFGVSIIFSIVSAAVTLLFLAISPVLSQTYYGDEWVNDSEKSEIDNERLYLFKKYNLSKRETEVCKLLLQGYTLRQISAMLSIGYPTVNTYCTSLYRKLCINSRTELIILFKDYAVK